MNNKTNQEQNQNTDKAKAEQDKPCEMNNLYIYLEMREEMVKEEIAEMERQALEQIKELPKQKDQRERESQVQMMNLINKHSEIMRRAKEEKVNIQKQINALNMTEWAIQRSDYADYLKEENERLKEDSKRLKGENKRLEQLL